MSFVPHSDADRDEMLAAAGVAHVDELFADIPADLRLAGPLDLPPALSEWEALRRLQAYAAENPPLLGFAGAGIYDHHVPAAVDHLVRRSEFYTAYTPYQPEVSQGTLQVIYEFQTMVCELTGMDVANASMYDGASATAEAALMSLAVTRRNRLLVAEPFHPHYLAVLRTYLVGSGTDVVVIEAGDDGRIDARAVVEAIDDGTAGIVAQNPNFFGILEDLAPLAGAVRGRGGLLVASVPDALSLAVLRSPGEMGADIVAAEGQAFGNAPSFGGPVLGLFAARQKLIRRMPGRIVGATTDVEGRRGYVLTLQTREQQIRREKATSNICTNQGLNALAATIHLALLGRNGLRRTAETAARNAHYARKRLLELGVPVRHPEAPIFREFVVEVADGRDAIGRGIAAGLLPGVRLGRFPGTDGGEGLLVAFTEKHDRADVDRLVEFLAGL